MLASPLQQQTIAGARSRFGSLSLASPRPLARDPRGPRNRKPPGTRPDSYKKERSRLEQASGHKGLPNAEGRRVEIGIVIGLVRTRARCCVVCVCGCSACATRSSTLPLTFCQLPFDKSQLRYLCISSSTRRSSYRFLIICTANAAVLAMKSAARGAHSCSAIAKIHEAVETNPEMNDRGLHRTQRKYVAQRRTRRERAHRVRAKLPKCSNCKTDTGSPPQPTSNSVPVVRERGVYFPYVSAGHITPLPPMRRCSSHLRTPTRVET